MSNSKKNPQERRITAHLSAMVLVGPMLAMAGVSAEGQSLGAYGADMCAELGITADECTLATSDADLDPSGVAARNDKTPTLIEHGRRVCEQEGVPIEDCQALPTAHRTADETILPASSFLTAPATIPVVDPDLVPVPVVTEVPAPAQRQAVRNVRPPAPVESGFRYLEPPRRPLDPSFRYVERPARPQALPLQAPAPPLEPGLRYFQPPAQPLDPGFRYFVEPALPIEAPLRQTNPGFRNFVEPPPQPLDSGFRNFVEPPAQLVGPPRPAERFRADRRSDRCFRAVRYSRPPSYRYVTC